MTWRNSAMLLVVIVWCIPPSKVIAAEDGPTTVCKLLESLPDWPFRPLATTQDIDSSLRQDANLFIECMKKINSLDLDEIRSGLVLYRRSDKYRPLIAFALLQYVFEVPKRGDPLEEHHVQSYTVLTVDERRANNSWPWGTTQDNQVTFAASALGVIRNGPPYRPIYVFEEYRKHFKRRVNHP